MDANIEHSGEYFWDNHEDSQYLVELAESLIEFLYEEISGPVKCMKYVPILGNAIDVLLDSDPITGYHDAYTVTVKLYIDDEVGDIMRKESTFTYMPEMPQQITSDMKFP